MMMMTMTTKKTMNVKNDHHSKFPNLSNWKEAWKIQGFNGIRTHDNDDDASPFQHIYPLMIDITH